MTPAEYVQDLGWVGADVWHANCVQLDEPGIELFGRTGTGVAHCPCSNMRLASGIAPVRRMLDRGVKVGLGVDGCASNDGGHMLGEARQAMLLQRVGFGPAALSARQALELAGRSRSSRARRHRLPRVRQVRRLHCLRPELDRIRRRAARPVGGADLLCADQGGLLVHHGRLVAENGRLVGIDIARMSKRHNALAASLMRGETQRQQVGPAAAQNGTWSTASPTR
jgi:8-oxoguanine deaminase